MWHLYFWIYYITSIWNKWKSERENKSLDSYLHEDYYDLNYNGRKKLSIFLIRYNYKGLFTPSGCESEKDQRKISLSLGRDMFLSFIYTERKRIFPDIFVALNIKLDSLWTHLEAMPLSLSYQCKQTPRSKMYMLDSANYSMIQFEFTHGIT